MEKLVIFSLASNTIYSAFLKLDKKGLSIKDRYDIYKPKIFPDWCMLCLFFWCGMIEYTALNVYNVISFNIIGSVIVHALAVCSLSIIIRKIIEFQR